MKNGFVRLASAALCMAACFGSVQAGPTGPQVVAGQASFATNGNVFSITNTPGAIINWQSFNVNANEITRFVQETSNSAVLNRIVGQDPSRILGSLQSNGKVFLINPNGIVFGQGARVDVGGLVASTLNISDSDFRAGKNTFTANAGAGTISNDGEITALSGGKVFLVATSVENKGIINAPNGDVVLAAGRSVKLVDAGNPDLDVVVSAPQDSAINLGQIVSNGGRVGIYGALVNQRGVVNADSAVVGANGRILLKASGDTVLGAGSVTTASSVRAVAGNDLTVDARIRADGDIDLRAANRLGIGAGGELLAPGYIDLQAERVSLAGRIGGVDGTLPIVSFTTANASTRIKVGSGVEDGLVLDPARLARIDAFGINIGSSAHTGDIIIDQALQLTGHLSIDSAGSITVRAPVVLSGADSRFTGTLHPLLGGGAIDVTAGGAITAANKIVLTGGAVRVAGSLGANDVAIDADAIRGAGLIKGEHVRLSARSGIGTASNPLRTSATTLSARNTQSGSAPINIVNDRALTLYGAVQEGTGNGGAIAIESVGGLTIPRSDGGDTGVRTSSGNISLVTRSPLSVDGEVRTESGNIRMLADNGGALTISSTARVASGSGSISLTGGSTTIAPGSVQVASPDKLSVTNTTTQPNPNPDPEPDPDPDPTTPPLPPALDSCLRNPATSGCVAVLEAKTRECILNMDGPQCAQVLPPLTACQVNPATLGCGVVLGRAALLACIANPKGAGCGAVLPSWDVCKNDRNRLGCAPVLAAREALEACIVNPKGPGCGDILPTFDTCRADGSILGCAPVLAARQALEACIANPKGAGCGEILPTFETCRANGGILGCAPVLAARQALEACIANPKGAGCGEILPTFETCRADGAILGCVPVLAARQALDACIVNPKGAGCAEILPNIDACRADGGILGCAPVLAARQALDACIVNPKGAGCAEVLPALAQCRADGGILGCAPVLARAAFDACLAVPTGAGCAGVLPSLPVCKASPGLEGCTQVRQLAFDACLKQPGDASCSGILPTLSQCVNDKGLGGCQVVLPTLEQCIGSPGLQGCSVQLPRLEQCAANPRLAGCQAVLPQADFCATHPGDASCVVFQPAPTTGGQGQTPVAGAQQAAVNLINTRTPNTPLQPPQAAAPGGASAGEGGEGGDGGKPGDKQAGPAQGPNTGVKNEKPVSKMYCN